MSEKQLLMMLLRLVMCAALFGRVDEAVYE